MEERAPTPAPTRMKTLLTLSLLLNLSVLLPVCSGLILQAPWAQAAYGAASPARGILLSVYCAILLASAVLLFVRDPRAVAVLLGLQVVYMLTTPWTVGTLHHPVVLSNLAIAAFHLVTLAVIARTTGHWLRTA